MHHFWWVIQDIEPGLDGPFRYAHSLRDVTDVHLIKVEHDDRLILFFRQSLLYDIHDDLVLLRIDRIFIREEILIYRFSGITIFFMKERQVQYTTR